MPALRQSDSNHHIVFFVLAVSFLFYLTIQGFPPALENSYILFQFYYKLFS